MRAIMNAVLVEARSTTLPRYKADNLASSSTPWHPAAATLSLGQQMARFAENRELPGTVGRTIVAIVATARMPKATVERFALAASDQSTIAARNALPAARTAPRSARLGRALDLPRESGKIRLSR
ncbi:MAG: hypothetical protein K2Y37_05325 [Pirellulales bacterium]|nr:hypothetical protein [Pirellulales bacterium]